MTNEGFLTGNFIKITKHATVPEIILDIGFAMCVAKLVQLVLILEYGSSDFGMNRRLEFNLTLSVEVFEDGKC